MIWSPQIPCPPAELHAEAVLYNEAFDLAVIPTCNKKPVVPWRDFQKRRPTRKDFAAWFRKHKDIDGIATICGRASENLAAVDFDTPSSSLRWNASPLRNTLDLPTARTGRGQHCFFRSREPLPTTKGHDGAELRGEKSYIVLAPSFHRASGRRYSWERSPWDRLRVVSDETVRAILRQVGITLRQRQETTPSEPLNILCPVLHPKDIDDAIQRAVSASIPIGFGERNGRLFELARRLRSFLPADTPGNVLDGIAEAWLQKARPFIRNKCQRSARRTLRSAFAGVRIPQGALLERAAAMAALLPDAAAIDAFGAFLPDRLQQRQRDRLLRIAALLQSLDFLHKNEPFPLSVRVVARLFGTGHDVAATDLKTLAAVGLIRRTQAAVYRPDGRSDATYWGYQGPQFNPAKAMVDVAVQDAAGGSQ